MTTLVDRDFVAQAVIVLAMCVGGWIIFVKPKIEKVGALELQIAEQAASQTTASPQTIEAAARRMNQTRQRLKQIEAYNRLAGDTSKLYGLVMDLADAHQVQVQSLQPGGAGKQSADQKMTAIQVELVVEGQYQNVATFLEAVCGIEAFIRPVSLQITPTTVDGQNVVAADFECSVLSFSLTDALAGMGGTSNAQP
jgi:Tfp pilus assembly protein PilO